jgi:hypothetical protein
MALRLQLCWSGVCSLVTLSSECSALLCSCSALLPSTHLTLVFGFAQFYVWYFHSLPYLLWTCRSLPTALRFSSLVSLSHNSPLTHCVIIQTLRVGVRRMGVECVSGHSRVVRCAGRLPCFAARVFALPIAASTTVGRTTSRGGHR